MRAADDPPRNEAEAEFQRCVERRLARHDAALVEVLAVVVAHDYPPEVAGVSFEVFSDGFLDHFPVHMYLMAEDDDWLDEGSFPPPVAPGLLELDGVYGPELPQTLHASSPESDDWALATETMIRWFAERWRAAGGAQFDRRAWIQHHDDGTRFDLVAGKWHAN